MLFRLLVILGLAAAGLLWFTRVRRRSLPAPESGPRRLAAHPRMDRAQAIRAKITELIARHGDKEASAALATQEVDAVLSQLNEQLDLRVRIDRALEAVAARSRPQPAAAGEPDDASELAMANARMADRLEAQQEQIARLRQRRELLDQCAEQTLVELENLHLALLDVLSSGSGPSTRLDDARRALGEASERLSVQASVDAEVQQLLDDG